MQPIEPASNGALNTPVRAANSGVIMLMHQTRQAGTAWRPYVISSDAAFPQNRFPKLIERTILPVAYARDVEIYGEGEPWEYIYMVVSGAVRTYKVLVDGRRQICAFHLIGDYFGLEADETHAFSAESISDSRIALIKRTTLLAQAEHDKALARHLWAMAGGELKRVHAHVLLLIKTAKERVAAFLLEMADRMPGDDKLELPMSRQDIADYLGLTIETVSRMLTDLEKRGAISLPSSRRIVLRNREALVAYGG